VSKRASPTLIGAFVLGAIAITVAAVEFIGSGRLFRNTQKFVMFFQGSVNGLEKGSPVKFRGVPIGMVTDILIAVRQLRGDRRIPVFAEIDEKRLRELGATLDIRDVRGLTAAFEAAGLRAQLQQQSFITGQLFINLDVFPGSPLEYALAPGSSEYPEIPTLPTKLEQVQQKIETVLDKLGKIDWDAVAKSVASTVDGLDKLVNSPDVHATLATLREALAKIRDSIGPLSDSTHGATKELQASLKRLQVSLDRLDALTDPKAPLVSGMHGTLQDIGEAARAVKRLADDLDRDPSVLIRGKGQ
jgi:paraquat-inducible protein B